MSSHSNRRIRFGAALVAVATLAHARAAAAQAGSDIFLVELRETGGQLTTGEVTRVVHRPGYDNQPHFLPDGRTLLYTAIDASGQADIYSINLEARRALRLTRTSPESEYSATIMPGGDRFSVIRVERDSTQRLWSFALDGSDPRLVLENIKPVGYHAWIDTNRVAVFVLGRPATLRIADTRTGEARSVAGQIGRSLHRVPGRNAISFVQLRDEGPDLIRLLDVETGRVSELAPALDENEYHAWTPAGTLLSARGSVLLRHDGNAWVEVADLAASGVRGISRLAVSPDGRYLALVAEE